MFFPCSPQITATGAKPAASCEKLTMIAFANVIGVHSDYLLDLFKYFDK